MLVRGTFEKARQYIETHSKTGTSRIYEIFPCVTISRETGAGSDIVSDKLIRFFNKHKIADSPEWTVFDKNLINKVLEDHHLPQHLQRFLEEEKHSAITSIMTELLTGEPSPWTVIKKEMQTIHQLARIGNVIIIGRGGNFITSRLKNAFHVRLVAPYEQRVKRIEELFNIDRKEAELYIKKDDVARKSFVTSNFHKRPEEPVHYHLVLNIGLISHSEAAKIIGKTVIKRFRKVFQKESLEEMEFKL